MQGEGFSCLLYEFDPREGPELKSEKFHNLVLSPSQKLTISRNSVPESCIPGNSSEIFLFTAENDLFCYCFYESVPDPKVFRGFSLHSQVLAINSRLVPLWLQLMSSASRLKGFTPPEINQLIFDFALKWVTKISEYTSEFDIDLPLFDGIMKFIPEAFCSSSDLLSFLISSGCYLSNKYFLGFDLFDSLFVGKLADDGRDYDIITLWEASILRIPILVIGSTPSAASVAVCSIASLSFPELVTDVHPYISITDPLFTQLAAHPAGIVGVSNPIASEIGRNFPLIFKVGFQRENGLSQKITSSGRLDTSSHTSIRSITFANTQRLRSAVGSAMEKMMCDDVFSFLIGKVSTETLETFILQSNILISTNIHKFVGNLVKTAMFDSIRDLKISSTKSIERVITADCASFSGSLTESDMVKLSKKLARMLDSISKQPSLHSALENRIREIASIDSFRQEKPISV